MQSEKAWKIGTITLFKQRQYLVSFCSNGDSVGSSFLSNDGRLIGEQISFRLQVFYQFQAKNYNTVTNLTQWYIIHSSPITLTAKRSPLNSTDRSALALSSREILGALTWNEHGNVHRGSFCSSVAGKKKKKKKQRPQQIDAPKILRGQSGWFCVWLIFIVYHEEGRRSLYISDIQLMHLPRVHLNIAKLSPSVTQLKYRALAKRWSKAPENPSSKW